MFLHFAAIFLCISSTSSSPMVPASWNQPQEPSSNDLQDEIELMNNAAMALGSRLEMLSDEDMLKLIQDLRFELDVITKEECTSCFQSVKFARSSLLDRCFALEPDQRHDFISAHCPNAPGLVHTQQQQQQQGFVPLDVNADDSMEKNGADDDFVNFMSRQMASSTTTLLPQKRQENKSNNNTKAVGNPRLATSRF